MEYEITEQLMNKLKGRVFERLSNRPIQVREDVYSQTLLQLVEGLKIFKGLSSVDTFAFTIADYVHYDYLRFYYNEKKLYDKAVRYYNPYMLNKFVKEIEHEKEIKRIRKKLKVLTPRQQQCLYLYVVCDLDYTEISEIFGVCYGTVQLIMENAKKRLRITYIRKNEERKKANYLMALSMLEESLSRQRRKG